MDLLESRFEVIPCTVRPRTEWPTLPCDCQGNKIRLSRDSRDQGILLPNPILKWYRWLDRVNPPLLRISSEPSWCLELDHTHNNLAWEARQASSSEQILRVTPVTMSALE